MPPRSGGIPDRGSKGAEAQVDAQQCEWRAKEGQGLPRVSSPALPG
jgi:hypothetical protein